MCLNAQTQMKINWLNHPESSSGQVMTTKKIIISTYENNHSTHTGNFFCLL